jgi:quinol monooxygenase YgiN
MSVLVSLKVPGDVDIFTKSLEERADEFRQISESAKQVGAIHHQFAVGPDYVLVVDEWDSAEQFETFFTDPKLQQFIGEIGGDTSVPPEITVGTSIDSPDRF